jgi:hypothetical protein
MFLCEGNEIDTIDTRKVKSIAGAIKTMHKETRIKGFSVHTTKGKGRKETHQFFFKSAGDETLWRSETGKGKGEWVNYIPAAAAEGGAGECY